ncbi:hypothetical protein SUGI_0929800 [Cryptomeria japonica]|nr:hypothetical protein SUGI_0929800 [Cryptomeria japonica]
MKAEINEKDSFNDQIQKTSKNEERGKDTLKDVLITSECDQVLGKRVSIAGEKLGHLSLSKEDLLSSLEEMAKCLQELKQSPSQLIQNAIAPTVNFLGEHRLLRHPKKELIVESLHGLHDDKAPTFNRRTKNLDITARTRSFVLMLDLHCDELILQMFQCFIAEIRKRHPNKVKTDIFDILSMILDENDIVCEQLRSDLLHIWRTELRVSATAYDFPRSLIELKIEKFREQLNSEELVMWGLQVSPPPQIFIDKTVEGIDFLEESTCDHTTAPVELHDENIPSSSESAKLEVECMERTGIPCIETLNFAEEENQSQSNASHSLHSLWNQLKVNEDGIVAALSHHDEMHKLVENYLWMIQLERRQKGMEAESSLDSLQMIKEGLGAMKANYLHLLSDRDHLLNLVEIYSDALRRKEEEIDDLCLQLSMVHSSLHKAEKTITGPSVIQEYDARTLEIKQIIEGIDEIHKYEMAQHDFSTFPNDFSLHFGEEHVGYRNPASPSWILPPISLFAGCPTMPIRILSGCTLGAAAMDIHRRDWNCLFVLKFRSDLEEDMIPSEFCMLDLSTDPATVQVMDGTHVGNVDAVEIPALMWKEVIRVVQHQHGRLTLYVKDSQCGCNVIATPYFRIFRRPLQLLQVDWREFLARTWLLVDLMLQFVVSIFLAYFFEHFQSSVQTIVEDFLGIAQLPSISTCGSIRHYSHHMMSVYMPLDGDWLNAVSWVGWCSRVSFQDTWRLGDNEEITVYVQNAIVMMYDSEVDSMITSFQSGTDWHHFGDIPLRDAEGHPLRWTRFHFLLPRVELGNGVSDVDLVESPLQDILHGIDLSLLRIFSIGFDDNLLMGNQEMTVQFEDEGLLVPESIPIVL